MPIRFLMLLAVVTGAASGCRFYQPRPVRVSVRDGDTGEPIAGAHFSAIYLAMLDFGVPFATIGPGNGVTDQEGKLTLCFDPVKETFCPRITAEGYPAGVQRDAEYTYYRLSPRKRFQLHDDYCIEMFRGAKPTAMITLLQGYRGPVVVRFAVESWRPAVPGQRTFEYVANHQGHVEIRETALFQAMRSYNTVRVRTLDGEEYQTHIDIHGEYEKKPEGDVALRFISCDYTGQKTRRHLALHARDRSRGECHAQGCMADEKRV